MERKISYLSLVAPEYWEALEKSEVSLALNKTGYFENTYASFRQLLVSVSQETQNLFLKLFTGIKSLAYFSLFIL